MEFVLEVRPPEGAMYYVALPQSGILTVGREAPADIVIRDRFLSRSHFQLQCAEMLHILTDPGSSNGTYVNGMKLRQSVLRSMERWRLTRCQNRQASYCHGSAI